GLGLGLIFKAKATSGGSDIVAMMIGKYTKLPMGQLMILVDSAIVLVGLVAFQDWKIPLYSLIVIFITGKVVDLVLEGANYEKVLFIISEKSEEIRNKIVIDLNRGGTFLKGEGMWGHNEKSIIFTVVNRREMSMLQEYINHIDPKAFVTVLNATEILGNGFKSLKDKIAE
ncbi:MAG: YitT family protein, partial [Bacteroidetes bacterium CG_4_10_14_3_um_filter_42_6]